MLETKEKYFEVNLYENGKFEINELTDGMTWGNQIYLSSRSGIKCTGTHCKEINLEKTKLKLVNQQIRDTEKEVKRLNKYLKTIKSLIV